MQLSLGALSCRSYTCHLPDRARCKPGQHLYKQLHNPLRHLPVVQCAAAAAGAGGTQVTATHVDTTFCISCTLSV